MASSSKRPLGRATAFLMLVATGGGMVHPGLAEPQGRETNSPVVYAHTQQSAKGEQPALLHDGAPNDASLTELVEALQHATGEKKVEALEVLVTELVAQNASMRLRLLQIQPRLMHHVAEHLAAGMSEGVRRSIAECPMLQAPPAALEDRDHSEDFNNENLSADGPES